MRISLAALAATVVLSTVTTAPARAAVTQPVGPLCAVDDLPLVDDEFVVDAGPIVLADEDDPTAEHTATITCSLVHEATPTHAATPIATVTSPPGTRVVRLPSTGLGMNYDDVLYFHVCTRLDLAGGPLYWHDHSDRNTAGYWTTSSSARCANQWESGDARAEDLMLRAVLDPVNLALAETEPLAPVADAAVCAVPEEYRDLAGTCGAPALATSVSIVRTPATGAVARRVPYGWTCTDEQTGLVVVAGSAVTSPDPAVSCVPPATVSLSCEWVQVSGLLAPTTLGRVAVSTGCGAKAVTRWLSAGNGRLAEWRSGTYQAPGVPPWRCAASEATPAEPAYLMECHVVAWPT